MFKDDCPISSREDDKLNRRNFAESLAKAITYYENDNCLTISFPISVSVITGKITEFLRISLENELLIALTMLFLTFKKFFKI